MSISYPFNFINNNIRKKNNNSSSSSASVSGGKPTKIFNSSTFVMSQLSSPQRVYQRSSLTGGDLGKGTGYIPVTLNVSKAGQVMARCRAYSDGITILQTPWIAANVVISNGVVNITGISARQEQFYLDLSGDGVNWQNGTVPVFMGRLIAVSGQSQAVRQIAKVPAYVGTMASLGVNISNNCGVFASVDDTSITISTASWALPSDSGPYTSTFTAEFLRQQVSYYGVACGLVGYAKGDTAIADWSSGSAQRTKLLSILDSVGGFEAFYWHQGGNDAGLGTTKTTYKAALDNLFTDITLHNNVLGTNFTKVLTAMATRLSAGAGTTTAVQTIRQASKEWANTNNGIYLEPHDINLEDSVHQGQPGNIILAQHVHRALSTNDIGPVMGTPTRAAGSAVIAIPITFSNSATSIILTGSPETRFTVYPTGTTSGALTVSSVAWDNTNKKLNLTLSSTPADSQALDVYSFLHPDPSATLAYANMIRDDLGRSLEPTTSGPVICAAAGAATAPSQMAAPTLTSADSSIIVTRASDPSNGGSTITSYDLRYSTDQTTWTVVAMTTNPQTISGLTNGTTYYVQTRANNAIGNGTWGTSSSVVPNVVVTAAFIENFTDTDGVNLSAHTSDSGHTWTAVLNTMLIGSNEVYGSVSPATYRSSYTPTSADSYVQATFKVVSIITSTANWMLGRSTATNTWYQGGYQQNGANGEGWYIGKTVAGTFTVLGFASTSLSAGNSKVVKMTMQGTTIKLIVDGTEVISVTDSSITTAGNVGLRKSGTGNETTSTGIHIDNMTAGTL